MSLSYDDTIDKLVEDNHLHWESNMPMKLACKGLLPQIIKLEPLIAGDVSLTYQVYIRGALTAAEAWTLHEGHLNKKMLKNRFIITKKLHSFKMEPGTKFAVHVDKFKKLVLQMESIGESLDETRQLVLLFRSLTEEYRMLATVLENTPNVTLAYAIQALSGVEASDESSSVQERAFATMQKNFSNKPRFRCNCFYCKKPGHKEFECRKKKTDEGRGQVLQAQASDFAFTAPSTMTKPEWLVDSGASSHMTSVRDKFVSMRDLKTPVCINVADGTTIDTGATGTVGLKLMDGTSVTMSGVLYISEVKGSLILVSKLTEKDVVAQFSKDKGVFRYGYATIMEAKRSENVYQLKAVGDEVCHAATTRKEPWAVMHARLGHILYKCYEQLLPMAEGVPRVTDRVKCIDVCADCCMVNTKVNDFPRHPDNLVKSARVLDLVHTDVMSPKQSKTPGGCTYVVPFIVDYSRHGVVYFMKTKSDVLSKFKIYKAAMENATDKKIKRLRSDNGGEALVQVLARVLCLGETLGLGTNRCCPHAHWPSGYSILGVVQMLPSLNQPVCLS
ncbi:hypothetical protein PC120_g9724 [Phytophthora cactorum]|nr:hypothetical protein PC120_g9724 [Phytophthora cactorum]